MVEGEGDEGEEEDGISQSILIVIIVGMKSSPPELIASQLLTQFRKRGIVSNSLCIIGHDEWEGSSGIAE